MTDTLTPEQSAALVAAANEPTGRLVGRICTPQGNSELEKLGLIKMGEFFRLFITPAGRIVAQLCKQLAEVQAVCNLRDLACYKIGACSVCEGCAVFTSEAGESCDPHICEDCGGTGIEPQQPYWRPIAECGELPDGWYCVLFARSKEPETCALVDGEWSHSWRSWDGDAPSGVMFLGPNPNPVTVPAAPEVKSTL